MSETEKAIIAAIIRGGLNLWASRLGKGPDWKPTAEDIQEIYDANEKTPEDFYKEAAGRLGVPWPPVEAQPLGE